jgi:formyl-CoA transferase
MLDTALMLMASLMTLNLSSDWMPAQSGNEAWSASPSSGAFETADGMLMLAANNDAQFERLCNATGRSDILLDARWRSPKSRQENSHALRETLNETFLRQTAAQWESVLEQADVPAARVRSLDEVLAEAHVHARGLTSEINIDGHDAAVHVPAMSFKANGLNMTPQTPPSPLGADTEEVLLAAGIAPARITALRSAGVI